MDYIGSSFPFGKGNEAFEFTGVSMRMFPLRANLYTLTKFCRDYLPVPEEIAEFEPALPYVFLQVISYEEMEAPHAGWIAQDELLFSVPLKWKDKGTGKWEWASVAPFIYVDDDLSALIGREVYGWTKTLTWVEPGISTWIEDPRKPSSLLTLETMLFPDLYAGKPKERRVFLEIERRPPASPLAMPPDFTSLSPLVGLQGLAEGSLSVMTYMGELLWGALLNPSPTADLLRSLLVAERNALLMRPMGFKVNNINLKQFRSSIPGQACYQAVTNTALVFQKFNAGGLLGDREVLCGDPTGGYRIHIYRYLNQPIIESLGLEVAEETSHRGVSRATLKPILPVWMDLDIRNEPGERLCWRAENLGWSIDERAGVKGEHAAFVTARRAAEVTVEGPFTFPDAAVRVLPLRCNKEKLKSTAALPMDFFEELDYELRSDLVFLIVLNIGKTYSSGNNLGSWADREVLFVVPVTCEDYPDDSDSLLPARALYIARAFSNSFTSVSTSREATGFPTKLAEVEDGLDPWVEARGPAKEHRVLGLRTKEYPALGVGAQRKSRTLLEIVQETSHSTGKSDDSKFDEMNLEDIVKDIVGNLSTYMKNSGNLEKWARFEGSRREDLSNIIIFNNLALNQFRHSESPGTRACYQALLKSTVRAGKWYHEDIASRPPLHGGWLGDGYKIRVYRYESNPIVRDLALEVDSSEIDDKGRLVEVLRPVAPFWVDIDLEFTLEESVVWRVDDEWRFGPGSNDSA